MRLVLRDVAGPVLTAGSRGYAAECATVDPNRALRPAIVVGATSEDDVRKAVAFAGRQGMPVAVKSTAHQAVHPADGGVLITTGRMKHLSVETSTRTVLAGAGLRWSEVMAHTAELGLAPVMGSAPGIGVVGYTLGGGQSPLLGRTHGYAADHVRRIDVVTADGEPHTVTPDREPSLFWALLGGKGNFGVVTRIGFRVFPVTRFHGGGIFFAGEHLAAVLEAWREWVPTVPDEMTSSLAVRRGSDLPAVPRSPRGASVVHVRIGHQGSAEECDRLVAPLRAVAPVLLDTVGSRPVTAVWEVHGDPATPSPRLHRSLCLRELPPKAVDVLVRLAGSGRLLASLEIRALGGALDREPEVPNAVATRGVPFVVLASAAGGVGRAGDLRGQLAEVVDGLAPWAADRSMVNFLSEDEAGDEEGVRAAYGHLRYARLADVKRHYDPANLFRLNHNIRPS
ncbi:FAD-binding oxidoreductase [Streptomyces sp. E5N91]|uniref:FAD-binding oxidoreductase n=1 Tax=Streptomyces sp. E5N91 TaxID=1851996 RepID=UPI000EF5B2DF|nr:FAD-binding oxidoreductase [Streptomyces sp. E5N91]